MKHWNFHKLDEMEQQILLKSQRAAYFFLVGALMLWSFYESWQVYAGKGKLNLLPCLLLFSAAVVQGLVQQMLTRRAVQGDEDSYETGPLARLVVLACVAAGLIATLGAAFLLMGVQA